MTLAEICKTLAASPAPVLHGIDVPHPLATETALRMLARMSDHGVARLRLLRRGAGHAHRLSVSEHGELRRGGSQELRLVEPPVRPLEVQERVREQAEHLLGVSLSQVRRVSSGIDVGLGQSFSQEQRRLAPACSSLDAGSGRVRALWEG